MARTKSGGKIAADGDPVRAHRVGAVKLEPQGEDGQPTKYFHSCSGDERERADAIRQFPRGGLSLGGDFF